jgi:surface carbohydrate biosynthesis protein
VTQLRLEQLGHRVLLATAKDLEPNMLWFRPDCIVLNHLFSSAYIALARKAREAGIAVVLLPTEGVVHRALAPLGDGEFSDYRMLDLYLAWGEEPATAIRARWGFDAETAPVLGFPRLDFYHERFTAAVTPREHFLRALGFDPARKVVCWATQFPYAHLGAREREKFFREQSDFGVRASYERLGLDPARIPDIHAAAQKASADAFCKMAAALPDTQFIIRPHPAENRDFYRALIQQRGLVNVRFCPQDYIWNVLNAVDVHVHRHCTTAVEGWMWRKPTIELALDPVPELAWPEREAGSDIVSNSDALIDKVKHYLGGAAVDPAVSEIRRAYISHYMGAADGRRSETAADLIDQMLCKRDRRRRIWSPLPGVRGSFRAVAAAALRQALARTPDESLRRGKVASTGPEDKLVSRRDVANYKKLVERAMAARAAS